MKGLILTCLLTIVAICSVNAQNHIILKGQTRDSTYAPIAFANVIDTATQEMKAFAVTDVKGGFQLRLEANKVYELKVTFVGYAPINEYLKLEKEPEDPLFDCHERIR